MPVPILISELSTTAASNFPAGGDSPANLDDVQRAHAAFIAKLRDESATIATAQTLTNKTLTAPVINSPTGIVKADVGLSNVDNTSDATKNAAVATLTNKTLTNPSYSGATANGGTVTTIDINGGTVDGTVIGGASAAAGSFTTVSAVTSASTGVNSAQSGAYRAPNAQAIRWRNAANSADGMYLMQNASDKLAVYDAANSLITEVSSTGLAVTGIVTPEADNTRTLGTAALRWSVVYAGTGTINTSDAREKTPVHPLTLAEINAAKQLSKEIGAYKFLGAVAAKGAAAREHIGMTVQRVIEILTANGLDPFNYGFVCYDAWADVFVEHPAIPAVAEVLASEGVEAVAAVAAVAAWTEQTQTAGDRYAFRMDELLMFISRGFEARLTALEVV